jgi:hypothetical protein
MNYIALVFTISVLVLVNEGLVELVSKSVFFSFLRDFLSQSRFRLFKFFGDVVNCPYCCSVWTAFGLTSVLFLFGSQIKIFNIAVDFIIVSVLIHRLSNHFHDIADRYFSKSYLNKE